MGWIVFIVICIIVFVVVNSNKSTSNSKRTSTSSLKATAIQSAKQRMINVPAKPQKSPRETQIRRLLQEALKNRCRLTMTYETGSPLPGDAAIKNRDIDIYGVGDDYIEAFCYYRNELRTFKISRIISILSLEVEYEIPPQYTENGWVTDGWEEIESKLDDNN